MGNINHERTKRAVCPYCGYNHDDSWEFVGDDGEVYCESCEMLFKWERNYKVTYTTYKMEVKNEP